MGVSMMMVIERYFSLGYLDYGRVFIFMGDVCQFLISCLGKVCGVVCIRNCGSCVWSHPIPVALGPLVEQQAIFLHFCMQY
jgi:hypothetical protein